jgi:hypothetical protein
MGKWMYRPTFSWTSALVGGEWSVSRPGRFTPGERAPGTHLIGWVDPRAGLDDVEKRKFLTLSGLELRFFGHPTRSQSLYRLRYPGSRGQEWRSYTFTPTCVLSTGTALHLRPSEIRVPFLYLHVYISVSLPVDKDQFYLTDPTKWLPFTFTWRRRYIQPPKCITSYVRGAAFLSRSW